MKVSLTCSELKFKVEFNAQVTMGSAIKGIHSPSHKLKVEVLSEAVTFEFIETHFWIFKVDWSNAAK